MHYFTMMSRLEKTLPQIYAAFAAALGSLCMGIALAWTAPVELEINDGTYNFYVDSADFSWIGSVVPLGAAFACIPTGFLVDLIGRKKTMLFTSVPLLIGWIFIIWPAAVEMLIVGRFITGFCGGIICVVAPMYIAEIAETNLRGILISLYQFALNLGIELAYVIGAYTSIFWFSITCAFFPILFGICVYFVHDSPQYLLKKGRHENAKKALQSFRGLMATQQLCGLNAITFYTVSLFEATGSNMDPEVSTMIVGAVILIFIIISMSIVDWAGRRVCLLISTIGMAIFVSTLGFYFLFEEQLVDQGWLPLTTLIGFSMTFAMGAGPVVWIIGAEIFSSDVKGLATGLGATINWSLAFLVTKFYGPVSNAIGESTAFLFFAMSGRLKEIYPQIFAAGAATLGALAMGMVLGWSSPVELYINDGTYNFYVDPTDFSWIGSVVPLGAAFACIPTGFFVDLIGRKNTMLFISVPFVIGWIFIIWPAAVEMLIVGRFITGFCGGLFCVASPLYIAEIAETKLRGILSSFYQLLICVGVELAYVIGAYTPIFWFSIISALIPIIFAVVFFFVPESPQYLLKKGRHEDAKNALQWFRGPKYNTEQELEEMKFSVEESMKNKTSFAEMFQDRVSRKGIFILIGLMAMQQLSGINAVVFYSASIFEATGSDMKPEISAIIVGGVMLFATLPSMAIVDWAGRKVCLMISTIGMAIFISILGFYFLFEEELAEQGWLPLTTLIGYFIVFSMGAGPVVWVIGAEIFAPEVKGPASGVGATSNWSLAFLVTKFYGPISDAVGKSSTFLFFGICCVFGALHVYFFVPETKGKSTEQILKEL
ncbi:hypothetical protein B566_EDAN009315 [Ephemera danica]|nr:hypothetical protein B566_EDAN009315 [Ephemera danica]